MNYVALESLDLYPVRLPMRHRFRRVDHRDVVLVRGPEGWGEFSPFSEYAPEVTARWLASALESACSPPPPLRRERVAVNVTVPAVGPDVAAEIVADSGADTAKVKVAEPGQDASDDMARLAAVRAALGDDGKIRIDVNAAWDVDTAVDRIAGYSEFRLEYVEQPVATIEEMVRVRGSVGVPIAADESVRLSPDPLSVVEAGGADILVLKVQPMGGVSRTLDVAQRAEIPVVISSALESSVGMVAGLRAAAALPELPYACGLGTVALFDRDVVDEPLVPHGGQLAVRTPEPSMELIMNLRPDRAEADAMLARMRAAAELLT